MKVYVINYGYTDNVELIAVFKSQDAAIKYCLSKKPRLCEDEPWEEREPYQDISMVKRYATIGGDIMEVYEFKVED